MIIPLKNLNKLAMITITRAEQEAWFARKEAEYMIASYYATPKDVCLKGLADGTLAVETCIEYALMLASHISGRGAGYVWQKVRETILAKGDDYANENRFSAFIAGGEWAYKAGHKTNEYKSQYELAHGALLSQIGIKIHRLQNLLKSKDAPKFESLQDNAYDLLGYMILRAMMQEKK